MLRYLIIRRSLEELRFESNRTQHTRGKVGRVVCNLYDMNCLEKTEKLNKGQKCSEQRVIIITIIYPLRLQNKSNLTCHFWFA